MESIRNDRPVKLGRNDRCHCGSGKKYKHCHWQPDQQQPPVLDPPPVAATPPPLDFVDVRRQMQALSKQVPGSESAEIRRLMNSVELLVDYELHAAEIEAAQLAIEPYYPEFDALLQDKTAAFERMRRLFGEEPMVPLRFHAPEIRRAFAAVGYPGLAADRRTAATFRKAILFLADTARRQLLTTRLLRLLPEYVSAGRHLDAYLLLHCAMLTTDETGESNPFLYAMFEYGLMEWDTQRLEQDGDLLRRMGLNLEQLRELSPDELEHQMQELIADPDRAREMESFVKANPDVRAALEAQCASADSLSILLLDRADAGLLLPTEAESLPWLEIFQQRLMANTALVAKLQCSSPGKKSLQALSDLMWEWAGEMAVAIFIPARVTQLKTALREFATQHRAAGDYDGHKQAEAALLVLGRSPGTGDQHFLASICYTVLRDMLRAMGELTTDGDDRDPSACSG